jgi:predicted polyphosphate/ATP-dependent NAD kinase
MPGPDSPRGPLRVGLLVNPVAGLGGPGGFKGSDLDWRKAIELGYAPSAPDRARRFVELVGPAVAWITVPGAMGGDYLPGAELVLPDARLETGSTSREDTVRAAQAIAEARVDLLTFLGGDGTATDVARAVDSRLPTLGVPAGVKITSAVYTHDVAEAAWLVRQLRPGFETIQRDVTDLDEAAYREGHVDVELKGSLKVPLSPMVQEGKVATPTETPMEPLVEQVLQEWDGSALTFVGAGSVCLAIKDQFWGKPTILGVDAILGNRIVASDLDDRRITQMADEHLAKGGTVRILLSTIGGQGMLLGRGTQVFRPELIRRVGWDNLKVVAPPEKLLGLKGLHIDTGDPELDASAPRHVRVTTGWNETRMVRLLTGARATPAEGEREPGPAS